MNISMIIERMKSDENLKIALFDAKVCEIIYSILIELKNFMSMVKIQHKCFELKLKKNEERVSRT